MIEGQKSHRDNKNEATLSDQHLQLQDQKKNNGDNSALNKSNNSDEEVEESDQSNIETDIFEQLEEWLAQKGDIIVGGSEYFMQFFKVEENIEIILNFILDPGLYPPSSIWVERFPELRSAKPNFDPKIYKQGSSSPSCEYEVLCSIAFRSYRLV